MKLGSAIAVYFLIWWITLFLVLPFGVKNAHEAGEKVGEGHEPGAPVAHGLLIKAAVNTVIAAVVFAAIYWAVNSNILGE